MQNMGEKMIHKLPSRLQVFHSLIAPVVIGFALMIFASAAAAQAVRHSSDFNHMRTGFPLTGVHINVECETCHTGGIFKGTPTDCAGCHTAGRRVVAPGKHATHIITNAPCESCHTNTVTFQGARYDHVGVQPNACGTCHNGGMVAGKPGGHLSTNASCDTCHRTSAWIPAGYNHIGVAPGSCETCHNGSTAPGKGPSHVVTTYACDSCHRTSAWVPAHYNHIGVTPGTCATCHNGTTAAGKPSDHVATTSSCDSCHMTTAWLPAGYNHIGVVANTCANCHGVTATGKPANHIPTAITDPLHCDTCHLSTTSWSSEKMNHNNALTGCKVCHNTGSPYLGDMRKETLGSHEGSKTTDDCSQSGCHKPLGNKGILYQEWD